MVINVAFHSHDLGLIVMVTGSVSNVPQSSEANRIILRTHPLFLQIPVRLFTKFRASWKEGSRVSEGLGCGVRDQ